MGRVANRQTCELTRAEGLDESEGWFAAAFEHSPLSMSLSNLEDGRFVAVNGALLRDMESRREEVIGRTALELDLWVDVNDRTRLFEELRAKGAVDRFEARFRTRTGREIVGLTSWRILEVAGKRYLLGQQQDITATRRAEEALVRRGRQLAVLSRISQEINTVLETPAVLRQLVASGMELVGATSGAAGLMEAGQMVFREYNQEGKVFPIDYRFRIGGPGVPAWVMEHPEPYCSNDTEHDPHVVPEIQRALGFRTLVDVPVLSREGRLLGCFELHNKAGGGSFDAQDVGMLQSLAAATAVALDNAQLLAERKRAEQSLRATSAELQTIFDAVPALIWYKDTRNNILRVNAKAAALVGMSAAQIEGHSTYELYPVEAEQYYQDDLQVIRSGQTKVGIVEPLTTTTGDMRWVRTDKLPIRDQAGNVTGVLVIALDITEWKRAEAMLWLKNNAIASSTSGIVISDLQGRLTYGNPAFAALWGYAEAAELVGRRAEEFAVHPEDVRQVIETLHTRERWSGEIRAKRRDDGEFWAELTASLVRDERGTPVCMMATILDVTERRQAEAALAQAKEEAEQANHAKDQFLAVLSHELRTPLTPVLAALSALEADRDPASPLSQDVAMMRQNVELEARLIDDLLDLTRISRGQLRLDLQPVNVEELLAHALGIVRPELEAKKQTLQVLTVATEHVVRGDPARLEQVFWNVLKNAVKFTPKGGRIEVRTANGRPQVWSVEVRDTGIGIHPEMLSRVFDAFKKGGAGGHQFGGLGLGLAISQTLVERHGGRIWAASDGLGKGATFTVELGTVREPVRREHPTPPRRAGTVAPRLRILLVEDDVYTAQIMGRLLRGMGHHVETAGTQQEGIDKGTHGRFELLLCDIGLPDGSGLDVMRALKKQTPFQGIALTGYGMELDVEKSLAAGFAVHLTKPIDIKKLEETITQVCGDTGERTSGLPQQASHGFRRDGPRRGNPIQP